MTAVPTLRKKRETFFNQLKVLTGEVDEAVLQKAYSCCDGDISSAIQYLEIYKKEYEKDTEMPDWTGRSLNHRKASNISALQETPERPEGTMTRHNASTSSHTFKMDVPRKLDDPVIDLTDEDAQLQEAIKLSMECSVAQQSAVTGPCNKDGSQDFATASATFSAMKTSVKPTGNPYLRHRKSKDWPSGLKNIGNTCWFNSVIQSLFHLPVFRNLVLQYKPPSESPPPDSERYRNIHFMQELKNLFALLVGTHQSYVDPTICITRLMTAFVRDEKHQQQDVSEFTHKLLDWLEDAMAHKHVSSIGSTEDKEYAPTSPMDVDNLEEPHAGQGDDSNPMIDLFYGEWKAEGVNNGSSFTKPHKFGIFPLCISGIDNLHDSLEISTRGCSHLDHNETRDGIKQEQWFTRLPPVLIFELSRFDYNRKSETPEKIHTKFDFPHLLHMDRYMESNSEKIRQCREDSDELAHQLYDSKEELKRRRKISVGEKSFLVQDVLKCCTEFAASRRKRYLQDKRSHHSSKRTKNSSSDFTQQDHGSGDGLADDESDVETEEKIRSASIVEQCLKAWLDELEREKEGLRDDINDIQKRLESMYDDPALKQHPYELHAVLIHEGFAAAGHYWSYVKDHEKCRWLRYNDTEVRETDFDEMVSESIGGGQGLKSAYCLMYVDKRKKDMLMAEGKVKAEIAISADEVLRDMVDKHNAEFSVEMEDWDIKQAKLLSLVAQQNVGADDRISTVTKDRKESEGSDTGYRSSSSTEHKKKDKSEALSSWNHEDSMRAIQTAHRVYEALGAEETLDHVLKEEWDRLRKLEKNQDSSKSDVRLQHVAVYMFRNSAPRKIIERALLEQFADDRMSYDHRATEIMKCAKDKLRTLSPGDLNEEEYQKWHRDYRLFCRATCYLLQGLELWSNGRCSEALPHLANVKLENDKLSATASQESSPKLLADWDLGLKTVAQCLESLNTKALSKLEEGSEEMVNNGISILVDNIIPWIHLLPTEDSEIGTPLVERIRHDWRSLDIATDGLKEKYEKALATLMDPPTTFRSPALTKPRNAQYLCDRFQKVMTMITKK